MPNDAKSVYKNTSHTCTELPTHLFRTSGILLQTHQPVISPKASVLPSALATRVVDEASTALSKVCVCVFVCSKISEVCRIGKCQPKQGKCGYICRS